MKYIDEETLEDILSEWSCGGLSTKLRSALVELEQPETINTLRPMSEAPEVMGAEIVIYLVNSNKGQGAHFDGEAWESYNGYYEPSNSALAGWLPFPIHEIEELQNANT